MWKYIMEGITGPIVEELIVPARRQWAWRRALVESALLLGLLSTASWLMR